MGDLERFQNGEFSVQDISSMLVSELAGSSRDDDCDVVYQVRPGDTLSEIAARYNTTVGRLVEVNGIDNPDLI